MDDCDLTLGAYWAKHRNVIAKLRHWQNTYDADHMLVSGTLYDYDQQMARLAPLLTKSISELTFYDLQTALDYVRRSGRKGSKSGKPLKESTIGKYRSQLRDIFQYAQDHGDAYNILDTFSTRGTEVKDIIDTFFDPALPKGKLLERLKQAQEQEPYLPRSLRLDLQLKLVKLISEGLLTDGRYCGLAISFYGGLRPSECRALLWKDIVPFQDHPERKMLYLYKTQDTTGENKAGMKTDNAYRKVPIHLELGVLLTRRRKYVEAQMSCTDIGNLPICCFGNEFTQPSRNYQFATLASKVLNQLQFTKKDWKPYLIDLLLEEASNASATADSSDTHLSLYVLRRNFWTWLESSTQLSDMEKRYVMGHEMYKARYEDLRPRYNNEDQLYEMLLKMDHCILGQYFSQNHLQMELTPDTSLIVDNRGIVWLHLSHQQLLTGSTLTLRAIARETNDAIRFTTVSPPRALGGLHGENLQLTGWPASRALPGINCEYDNWEAAQNALHRKRGYPTC